MPPKKVKVDGSLYFVLRKMWKEAYPTKKKQLADAECAEFWKKHKEDKDAVDAMINQLKWKKLSIPKPILNGLAKLSRLSAKSKSSGNSSNEIQVGASVLELENHEAASRSEPIQGSGPGMHATEEKEPESDITELEIPVDIANGNGSNIQTEAEVLEHEEEKLIEYVTPAQTKCSAELTAVREKISVLSKSGQLGFGCDADQKRQLFKLHEEETKIKKRLKKLQVNQKASKKKRIKTCKSLKQLQEKYPDAAEEVGISLTQPKVGRPIIESQQPGLHSAILDIIGNSSVSAEARRRCETIRSNLRVYDLLHELTEMGFKISRTGLFLRLRPRRQNSKWGKRHVNTVNVKLNTPQNNLRQPHMDSHFAAGTIKHLYKLAELYGEKNVIVISQDDKSKIPLGIAAAKCQSPMLMRLDYEVRLPDHDWVVAPAHKLIPSVYAGLVFKNGKVSYSGPTFISIRSGKHESSTAASHANDIQRFFELPHFDYFCKYNGRIKPICILLCDSGPDESPRYPKTLAQAMIYFKKYNFDALFVASYAAHQSANNPVERRMAPLSKDLVGLVLPYQYFGSHLDNSKRTTSINLEKRNFKKAGEILASRWHKKIIDGFKTFAEFVDPPGLGITEEADLNGPDLEEFEGTDHSDSENEQDGDDQEWETIPVPPRKISENFDSSIFTEEWKSVHVRQSQYLIQITKCHDEICCGAQQTNVTSYLPYRFLPAPILFKQTSAGIECAKQKDSDGHFLDLSDRIALNYMEPIDAPEPMPFDYYCPSVSEDLHGRICSECGQYFPTKIAAKTHKKVHKTKDKAAPVEIDYDVIEISDCVDNIIDIDNEMEFPVIESIRDWLTPAFIPVVDLCDS